MADEPTNRILEILPRLLYSIPPIFLLGIGSPNELDIAILHTLRRNGALNIKDIHIKLDWDEIKYKRVSARIVVLQKKGFVREEVIGRIREKEITESGSEFLLQIEQKRGVYLGAILSLLDPARQERLADFLEKIPTILKSITY